MVRVYDVLDAGRMQLVWKSASTTDRKLETVAVDSWWVGRRKVF